TAITMFRLRRAVLESTFGILVSGVVLLGCTNTSLTSTTPSPAKCQVALTPTTATVAANGGALRFDVVTQPECEWTAASATTWISPPSPASGQGNAQITAQVAVNTQPSVRRGTLTSNGVQAAVTQDAATCQFAVSPRTRAVAPGGGTTTIDVTTVAGCPWT